MSVAVLAYVVPCKTDFDIACFQTGQSELLLLPKPDHTQFFEHTNNTQVLHTVTTQLLFQIV